MAGYTTQLGEVLCSRVTPMPEGWDWVPYPTPEVIRRTKGQLFNFDYPTFDASQKASFEANFLKRFWFNEIGEETFHLFQMRLDNRLNEIMPNFIEEMKLYDWIRESGLNWFDDVNLKEVKDQTIEDTIRESLAKTGTDVSAILGNNLTTNDLEQIRSLMRTNNLTRTNDLKSESDNLRTDDLEHDGTETITNNLLRTDDSDSWNKFSDTPQGALTDVENSEYLTNATEVTNHGTSADTGTKTTVASATDTGTVHEEGTVTDTGTIKDTGTVADTGTIENNGTVKNEIDSTTTQTKNLLDTTTGDNNQALAYTILLTGKRGSKSYIELLKEFKNLNMNINQRINNACADLFMLLWQ